MMMRSPHEIDVNILIKLIQKVPQFSNAMILVYKRVSIQNTLYIVAHFSESKYEQTRQRILAERYQML